MPPRLLPPAHQRLTTWLRSVASWRAWQGSAVAKKHLSEAARQEGYTVLRVLPVNRPAFLEVAQLFHLYGELTHRSQPVDPETQALFEAWRQGTQAVITLLRKTYDEHTLPLA